MLKNYTRQLFAQLSRHLPRRLVQRDPLPDARHLASGPIPESLGQHCLNVAAMDDQEIWRAFDSHPEGLNEGEVAAKILKHGDNQIPAQKPSPWWVHLWTCYRNPFNLLLTVLGIVSLFHRGSVRRRGYRPDGGGSRHCSISSRRRARPKRRMR